MKVELTCKECKRCYSVIPSRAKESRFCSFICKQIGVARRPVTWGSKISKAHIGMKKPWTSTRNKKFKNFGEKSGNWRGDNVGYHNLHQWVRNHFGKATKCEQCGTEKGIQWASKEKRYTRERKDWLQLCRSCHGLYERRTIKHIPFPFDKKNRQVRIIPIEKRGHLVEPFLSN